MEERELLMLEEDYDVVGISETWLNVSCDWAANIKDYSLIRTDRTNRKQQLNLGKNYSRHLLEANQCEHCSSGKKERTKGSAIDSKTTVNPSTAFTACYVSQFNMQNALWNLKAIASRPSVTALALLDKVHYSYAKIILTKKKGRIAEFFNPIEGISVDPFILERVEDENETLTYRKVDKEAPGLFTFLLDHPAVLIVNRESNENVQTSALYVEAASNPNTQLEKFKEWTKCKGLTIFKEFNNTVDYAKTCHGLLDVKTPLNLEKNEDTFTSWHLVAKSTASMDQHYNVRSLYTARLEICGKEQTLKEIISAPIDNVILELKFEKPSEDGNAALLFKTEDGFLLLGVQTKTRRTLYLASKTPTIKQSIIDKFQAQAMCFETEYNYIIPGSIKENDGEEVCARHLKDRVPTTLPESLDKWILMASAFKNLGTFLIEQPLYKETEYTLVNGTVHQAITLKIETDPDESQPDLDRGYTERMQGIDIEVHETSDVIKYSDSRPSETSIHRVGPSCNIFSSQEKCLLTCRKNHVPPVSDIIQFVKYVTCQNLNKILIHQPLSSSCSEVPTEVPTLDVEKIAGRWKLAAVSSNLKDGDVKFPSVFNFIVKDGEVTITDGTWTGAAKRIGKNRLQYDADDGHVMEMRFYEPLEDHLLIWFANEENKFLVLFSNAGHARPVEIIRFKHFAACLSTHVVFLRD
ncbi:uncharacterized protein LOC130292014 [Hyla sarda]|uniref:uncharacterized protein LOC130292014 n=1 Tax=Hyla sarda TaxID=327740 RepID=UPI0024C430FB|nr:uncharacterized protein LOC130292014 [Hyla sarda]